LGFELVFDAILLQPHIWRSKLSSIEDEYFSSLELFEPNTSNPAMFHFAIHFYSTRFQQVLAAVKTKGIDNNVPSVAEIIEAIEFLLYEGKILRDKEFAGLEIGSQPHQLLQNQYNKAVPTVLTFIGSWRNEIRLLIQNNENLREVFLEEHHKRQQALIDMPKNFPSLMGAWFKEWNDLLKALGLTDADLLLLEQSSEKQEGGMGAV
jgi:hypothetical protein